MLSSDKGATFLEGGEEETGSRGRERRIGKRVKGHVSFWKGAGGSLHWAYVEGSVQTECVCIFIPVPKSLLYYNVPFNICHQSIKQKGSKNDEISTFMMKC